MYFDWIVIRCTFTLQECPVIDVVIINRSFTGGIVRYEVMTESKLINAKLLYGLVDRMLTLSTS